MTMSYTFHPTAKLQPEDCQRDVHAGQPHYSVWSLQGNRPTCTRPSHHKRNQLGDYVLTGGELAAAIISDAVIRLVPGVISDEQSALSDCFQDDILAAPIYTRPADYKGWKVPEILLSGNEAKIRQWEFDQAMERTQRLRPDLLKG